jgi:hypothetical protein
LFIQAIMFVWSIQCHKRDFVFNVQQQTEISGVR